MRAAGAASAARTRRRRLRNLELPLLTLDLRLVGASVLLLSRLILVSGLKRRLILGPGELPRWTRHKFPHVPRLSSQRETSCWTGKQEEIYHHIPPLMKQTSRIVHFYSAGALPQHSLSGGGASVRSPTPLTSQSCEGHLLSASQVLTTFTFFSYLIHRRGLTPAA